MAKLPNVYQAVIKNKIENNKEMCIVEEKLEEQQEVEEVLKKIRTGLGPYNTKVEIETKDNVYITTIISKGKREVITEDNHLIPIRDITQIKIKK